MGLLCNRSLLNCVDASASRAYETYLLPLDLPADVAALLVELSLIACADDGFKVPAYLPRAPRADVGARVALSHRHVSQRVRG